MQKFEDFDQQIYNQTEFGFEEQNAPTLAAIFGNKQNLKIRPLGLNTSGFVTETNEDSGVEYSRPFNFTELVNDLDGEMFEDYEYDNVDYSLDYDDDEELDMVFEDDFDNDLPTLGVQNDLDLLATLGSGIRGGFRPDSYFYKLNRETEDWNTPKFIEDIDINLGLEISEDSFDSSGVFSDNRISSLNGKYFIDKEDWLFSTYAKLANTSISSDSSM